MLDMKIEDGEQYFLVKWKGFDESQCSWEPKIHLQGCQLLLQRFLQAKDPSRFRESKIKLKDEEVSLITDEPKDIINAIRKENGQIDFLVEWKPREDGTRPPNSIIKSIEFRKYNPLFLLEWYEERIKFPNQKHA